MKKSNLKPKNLYLVLNHAAELRFELKWQKILAETLVKRQKIPYGLPNRIGYLLLFSGLYRNRGV